MDRNNRLSANWRAVALAMLVTAMMAAAATAAEIHRWTDDDGHLHFGDSPPLLDAETVVPGPVNVIASGYSRRASGHVSGVKSRSRPRRACGACGDDRAASGCGDRSGRRRGGKSCVRSSAR